MVEKQGQKIRAGVSPPPFSGNAQKKTFFFPGGLPLPDIIKSNKRLIADPKVPAKARISRQKCHLRQNSVNCEMS